MHDDFVYKSRFVWSKSKAALNLKAHGISFEKATEVFEDLMAVVEYDGENSISEDRFNITGHLKGFSYVTVTFTYRGEMERIISARDADGGEIDGYNENTRISLGYR